MSSFVPSVVCHISFGYAAGCAAVAVPRRTAGFVTLGYALDAASGEIDPERAGIARS